MMMMMMIMMMVVVIVIETKVDLLDEYGGEAVPLFWHRVTWCCIHSFEPGNGSLLCCQAEVLVWVEGVGGGLGYWEISSVTGHKVTQLVQQLADSAVSKASVGVVRPKRQHSQTLSYRNMSIALQRR
jgi:hypothetical protein